MDCVSYGDGFCLPLRKGEVTPLAGIDEVEGPIIEVHGFDDGSGFDDAAEQKARFSSAGGRLFR